MKWLSFYQIQFLFIHFFFLLVIYFALDSGYIMVDKSLVSQLVKNLPTMWETGFDPWIGNTLGERKGYPLQYSGLENFMDCIVHSHWKRL